MSDLRRAVARPFQLEGAEALSREDFKRILSLKLNWFEPSEAERTVDLALLRGLLEEGDDGLRPGFEVGEEEVPMEFVPAVDLDADDLVERTISATASAIGEDRGGVIAGANAVQGELGNTLSMEASLLVHALDNGARLDGMAGEVARSLRKK